MLIKPPQRPSHPAPARRGAPGMGEMHYKESLDRFIKEPLESGPHMAARSLGWFSIALGVTQIAAGGAIARCMGVERHAHVIRGCGVREIANGGALLVQRRSRCRSRWLRVRAAGDMADLGLLGCAMAHKSAKRGRIAGVMALVGAVLVVDVVASTLLDDR